jgi:hypothetical protein
MSQELMEIIKYLMSLIFFEKLHQYNKNLKKKHENALIKQISKYL